MNPDFSFGDVVPTKILILIITQCSKNAVFSCQVHEVKNSNLDQYGYASTSEMGHYKNQRKVEFINSL